MTMCNINTNDRTPLLAKPPIRVDWSTTIQQLSTSLKGYNVDLELTAKHEMVIFFVGKENEIVELSPKKPAHWTLLLNEPYANGAILIIDIILGEASKEQTLNLVEGLGNRHIKKVEYLRKAKLNTNLGRETTPKCFNRIEVRHGFSVGEVHKLAREVKKLKQT